MKICPVCGTENKDANNFCNRCGTRLDIVSIMGEDFLLENEKTMVIDDQQDFENEETMVIDDQQGFENEETVVIDDQQDFENEKTVVIDDQQGLEDFENEKTVVIDSEDNIEEPPRAPNFKYVGEVPVYRDPQNDVENETAYIDHLRRLKGLLDDGIINEWEFEQKKKQILGLYTEQGERK